MIDYKNFASITSTDPNHPRGKFTNETSPNAGDGTIVRAEFFMDLYSFIFGLMIDQNVQPNGNEEYTETNELGNKQVWSVMEEFARPTGMVFTEYPNQTTLDALYPRLVFNNISSTYAGDFFRVEGGAASAFESGQQIAGIPRMSYSWFGAGAFKELVGNADGRGFHAGETVYDLSYALTWQSQQQPRKTRTEIARSHYISGPFTIAALPKYITVANGSNAVFQHMGASPGAAQTTGIRIYKRTFDSHSGTSQWSALNNTELRPANRTIKMYAKTGVS